MFEMAKTFKRLERFNPINEPIEIFRPKPVCKISLHAFGHYYGHTQTKFFHYPWGKNIARCARSFKIFLSDKVCKINIFC